MPILDIDKIKKTEANETLCYKGSVCCYNSLSCCFSAMARHKFRSLVITLLLLVPTSLFSVNIYIFTTSPNTNKLDYETTAREKLGFLAFYIYLIYIFGSFIEFIILSCIGSGVIHYNHKSPVNIYLNRFNDDTDISSNFGVHYPAMNLLISHTLMSLVILTLYLTNVDLSTYYCIMVGLFCFFFSSILVIYYTLYGLWRLLIIFVKHCILKPYYGCRNLTETLD
jgi:hypothetical protein